MPSPLVDPSWAYSGRMVSFRTSVVRSTSTSQVTPTRTLSSPKKGLSTFMTWVRMRFSIACWSCIFSAETSPFKASSVK